MCVCVRGAHSSFGFAFPVRGRRQVDTLLLTNQANSTVPLLLLFLVFARPDCRPIAFCPVWCLAKVASGQQRGTWRRFGARSSLTWTKILSPTRYKCVQYCTMKSSESGQRGRHFTRRQKTTTTATPTTTSTWASISVGRTRADCVQFSSRTLPIDYRARLQRASGRLVESQ